MKRSSRSASRDDGHPFLSRLLGLLMVAPFWGAGAMAQPAGTGGAGAAGAVSPEPASTIEAAFGPEAGAEALVLRVIASADSTIRLAGYAFSSAAVVDGLVAAARRGVDVQVVVDHGHNVPEGATCVSQKVFSRLAKAGVVVRTNSTFRHLHDKFIVVDGRHVQTGSYNYAKSANLNSENVIVIWRDPALAAKYLSHWKARFDGGKACPGKE